MKVFGRVPNIKGMNCLKVNDSTIDSVPMLVSIFPVNYQLMAHDKSGRNKFKVSLNVENMTTTLVA